MSILKRFYGNTRRPRGVGGRVMLSMMNAGHDRLACWGLTHLEIQPAAVVLDVGCGGGRNISHLLEKAADGRIFGVDYSPESVKKSIRTNRSSVLRGKAEVLQASVSSLPFGAGEFDAATAFETIYFWPDLLYDFMEVRRVLKDGGTFLICNEAARPEGYEKWTRLLNIPVYTKEELSETLLRAGFSRVSCHEHGNGRWLCVTARKPYPSEGGNLS